MQQTKVVDQLFYNRYYVNVEEAAFHSLEKLQDIGLMGVTDEEEARAVLARPRLCMVTIINLANFLYDGFKIQIINKQDASDMFDIIDKHLSNWKDVCIRLGYVADMPPFEDFEKLDNLAQALYEYKQEDKSVNNLMAILAKPLYTATNTERKGIYKSYLDFLYKYCEQSVNGGE